MNGSADRGWFVRLRVELDDGRERWLCSAAMSYTSARELAERHARSGRRARIVDPEGNETRDVPPPPVAADWWAMPP